LARHRLGHLLAQVDQPVVELAAQQQRPTIGTLLHVVSVGALDLDGAAALRARTGPGSRGRGHPVAGNSGGAFYVYTEHDWDDRLQAFCDDLMNGTNPVLLFARQPRSKP
jgi:hypothetical protein